MLNRGCYNRVYKKITNSQIPASTPVAPHRDNLPTLAALQALELPTSRGRKSLTGALRLPASPASKASPMTSNHSERRLNGASKGVSYGAWTALEWWLRLALNSTWCSAWNGAFGVRLTWHLKHAWNGACKWRLQWRLDDTSWMSETTPFSTTGLAPKRRPSPASQVSPSSLVTTPRLKRRLDGIALVGVARKALCLSSTRWGWFLFCLVFIRFGETN